MGDAGDAPQGPTRPEGDLLDAAQSPCEPQLDGEGGCRREGDEIRVAAGATVELDGDYVGIASQSSCEILDEAVHAGFPGKVEGELGEDVSGEGKQKFHTVCLGVHVRVRRRQGACRGDVEDSKHRRRGPRAIRELARKRMREVTHERCLADWRGVSHPQWFFDLDLMLSRSPGDAVGFGFEVCAARADGSMGRAGQQPLRFLNVFV
jgi:hypothetical protein